MRAVDGDRELEIAASKKQKQELLRIRFGEQVRSVVCRTRLKIWKALLLRIFAWQAILEEKESLNHPSQHQAAGV